MKIIVLYNLPGTSKSENIKEADDDTLISANDVCEVLKSLGHDVTLMGISQKDIDSIGEIECDLVFNLIEWSGRETQDAINVLDLFDAKGIKYTGCRGEGYRLSCDKCLMKEMMVKCNISTPKYLSVTNLNELSNFSLSFPVIAKPAMEHCAIGLSQKSVVSNLEDLTTLVAELHDKYQQAVIIEEFIDGMEAHVTVLEKDGSPFVLTPAVFSFKKMAGYIPIVTYDYKWNENSAEANMSEWVESVDQDLESKIISVAAQTFICLGGRSHSRIDMRIKDGELFVLEINNNPGIGWDEDSGLTHSCLRDGISQKEFVNYIVNSAI